MRELRYPRGQNIKHHTLRVGMDRSVDQDSGSSGSEEDEVGTSDSSVEEEEPVRGLSEYEKKRLQNIQLNKSKLQELGDYTFSLFTYS